MSVKETKMNADSSFVILLCGEQTLFNIYLPDELSQNLYLERAKRNGLKYCNRTHSNR